ncbi:hypothetical protein BB558_005354 [Smittium angustum]|uniref:U3 small nucleolar RNA-associated protein 22 n=1 Tax=Smittium angustum TaxID=133377 RepID=A0A2U1J0Q3_SMIAN|nr:hypothetical protein BB558_005354 [Smittium angustum]
MAKAIKRKIESSKDNLKEYKHLKTTSEDVNHNESDEFSEAESYVSSDQQESDESDNEVSVEAENHENKENKPEKKFVEGMPSNDELRALNETSKIFRSNLFKLQIDEMLLETKVVPQTSKTKELEMFLKKVTKALESSEPIPEAPLKKAIHDLYTKAKSKNPNANLEYKEPFLKIPYDTKHNQVAYKPPVKMAVVGSYALGLAARTRFGFNVDLAIQMPSELFLEKDHMNYRYFYKRSFYVECLLGILQENTELSGIFDFEYDYLRGDERLPIIVAYPKKTKETKSMGLSLFDFCIRLIPCISTNTFTRSKLNPSRNHVRTNFLVEAWDPTHSKNSEGYDGGDTNNPPTPNYNAALVAESQYFTHMSFLHNLCKQSPGFKDAVVMAKVWLSQRGFGKRASNKNMRGGDTERDSPVNGFLLSMILAWLVCGSRSSKTNNLTNLGTGLSSFQMFRALLSFLSSYSISGSDFALEFKKTGQNADALKPSEKDSGFDLDDFTNNYKSTFVDPTGQLNLLARVPEWEMKRLRIEAEKSCSILDLNEDNGFFPIFMQYIDDPTTTYDYLFNVEIDTTFSRINKNIYLLLDNPKTIPWEFIDDANHLLYLQKQVTEIITTGLANRVVLVEPRQLNLITHMVKSKNETVNIQGKKASFLLGIIVDGTEASKLVSLGPHPSPEATADPNSASSLEIKRYEGIWGPKSELRRFRDGAIRMSTVWGSANSSNDERSFIVTKMVGFLMRRHFGFDLMPGVLGSEDMKLSNSVVSTVESLKIQRALGKNVQKKIFSSLICLSKFNLSVDEVRGKTPKEIVPVDQKINKPFIEFDKTYKIYQEWTKKIIALGDDLPLQVLSIKAASPYLRGSSVMLPKQTFDNDDMYLSPIDTIIEFESSSKWPDDIMALQKVKAAFLEKLGSLYTKKNDGSSYNILSRNYGHTETTDNDSIMISGEGPLSVGSDAISGSTGDLLICEQDLLLELFDSSYTGFVYRISLKMDREKAIYEKLLLKYNNPLLSLKEAVVARKAKIISLTKKINHWNRTFEWRPAHHSQVSNFMKNHYNPYTTACRLFKRWLASHFLLLESSMGYISSMGVHGVPEELAELIVGYVFANKSAKHKVYGRSPSSGFSGFNRVLELLVDYKFNEEPLMVDLAVGTEDDQEIEKIDWEPATNHFNGKKSGAGMYIATPSDMKSEWFGHISALVYGRLKILATASLTAIKKSVETNDPSLINSIFSSPTDGYDFKLILDSDFCCRQSQSISKKVFESTKYDEYVVEAELESQSEQEGDDSGGFEKEEEVSEYKNLALAKSDIMADKRNDTMYFSAFDNNKEDEEEEQRTSGYVSNVFGLPKMVAFDPVSLLRRDLEQVYSKSAVFFHNVYGGNVIYGLWTPAVSDTDNKKLQLKANIGLNVAPSKKDSKMTVNKDAILSEMFRIGDGLVSKIKTRE